MIPTVLPAFATFLEDLLPVASTLTTNAATQATIAALKKLVPVAVSGAASLLTPIQNIIACLQGTGVVTAEQLTSLTALSASIDAAFTAAATDDSL